MSLLDAAPGLLGMYGDFFGLSIVAPILPQWVRSKERSAQWVGYIMSGQYGGVVVGSFAFGALADRFGNGVALATCMAIDATLFAASAFVPSPEWLLVVRTFAGLGAPQGLAIAWVAGVSSPHNLPKRMGLVAAVIHVGILSGTICAGFVSWRAACLASAVPPLISLLVLASTKSPPVKRAQSRAAALAVGVRTLGFSSVVVTMLANGAEITVHFVLLAVVLTENYGLSRQQFALSLIPAAFVQIFNHFYLLPIVIRLATSFRLLTRLTQLMALIYVLVILANEVVPSSPWPLLVLQNLAYWLMSFTQGVGNFASAKHADDVAPEAKAALIGLGRAAFSLGNALAPSLLIAVYLAYNVRAALAIILLLYTLAAGVSLCAANHQEALLVVADPRPSELDTDDFRLEYYYPPGGRRQQNENQRHNERRHNDRDAQPLVTSSSQPRRLPLALTSPPQPASTPVGAAATTLAS
ncbi:hypothetical protein CTAYLR_006839 [Chrysophaeum taylorii]|uniref:Major facilitator superfamily (MFS) profile domain-containing protein n=1 Tax=Chrysophaeum taylorii TaxID=2483200 RepID=A0AAD7UBD6_9STRA|nr:hypothetical protein CTAYLR_006839 [Chrysophaeum taylorii]